MVGVVTSLALVAGVLAFVMYPRGGSGAALALQLQTGEKYRYNLVHSIDASIRSKALGIRQPFRTTIDETIEANVVSVDEQGTATVEVALKHLSVEVDGEPVPVPAGDLKCRMELSTDGRLVSGGGLTLAASGDSGFTLPGTDQFMPVLPDHPVEPGDSWTKDFEVPFPFGEGALRYTSRNELLRYEEVQGVRTAVIQTRLALPLDVSMNVREMMEAVGAPDEFPGRGDPVVKFRGHVEMDHTSWFDPREGEPLKSEITGTMDIRMRFVGFPKREKVPDGNVRFTGTFDFELTRYL